MKGLLRFDGSVRREPAIDRWLDAQPAALGAIARRWFDEMRACGDDVRELMHDGAPTVVIDGAGLAYVNAFTAHVNVGFFYGAFLSDPSGLLVGDGKRMRHVKVRPGEEPDAKALSALIHDAYFDLQVRLESE